MTVVGTATLVESISSFTHDLRLPDVPGHAQNSARDRLLDALSTAVASRTVGATTSAVAAQQALQHGPGPCTVLPTRAATSLDGAAFVNGVAVHAILFEDIHLPSADHPGAVVVPAALAAAEGAATVTGTAATIGDLLLGVLAGYEVHLWLGTIAAPGVIARGFRTTNVFGAVGAAAAAATALRLPREQASVAIALGANMAGGFLEGFQHGTQEPYLQAGFAARSGVLAALLARAGARSTEHAIDGASGMLRGFADVTTTNGAHAHPGWLIGGVSTKPYPISGGKIAAVDSALAVREQGLDAVADEDILAVRVLVPSGVHAFPGADRRGPFETMYQAQDSTQYCVAAALLGRPIQQLRTVMDHFADPGVSDLTQRTEVVGEDGRTLSAVQVTLRDGRVLSAEVDRSDRQVPTVAGMSAKLTELTAGFWTDGTAAAVTELVTGDPAAPVAELTRLLREA